MTTQSALQYSSIAIHTHIHIIYGKQFFYEEQFRDQYLAQGHFGMRKTGI